MQKKLSKEQAQKRNYKIFRLRGFIESIKHLIPEDIWEQLSDVEKEVIQSIQIKIPKLLDEAKENKKNSNEK